MVTQKKEITPVDGTPDKRVILSIISDYDLKTGLCELVDNGLDLWMTGSRVKPLTISINVDVERQLISVKDNAGGVKREDLRVLVAPGGSLNDLKAELIGVFGVGGKRAGIALAENVIIKTRFQDEESSQLDITPEWLASEDWNLPAYAIPDIEPSTTRIELSHLRKVVTQKDLDELRPHLGQTYEWFVREGCVIELNGKPIESEDFEAWAFPPGYAPRMAKFEIDRKKDGKVSATITAGLITDRNPETGNYGAYFYCNHRLIAKEVKTRDVGYYITGEAGVPHPDASLCRAIVRLQGPVQLMPFTSSKTSFNFDHPVFQELRPTLIELLKYFSSLSRRFKDDWDHNVYQHDVGQIEELPPTTTPPGKRLILPGLPKTTKPRGERYKSLNKKQLQDKPWTLGLLEAMSMVDVVDRTHLETKNRISLILLDSNFEIALKEFIVNRHDLFPPKQYDDAAIQRLFSRRHQVTDLVVQKMPSLKSLIDTANYYYGQRNKLIHERATVQVTNADIRNYRSTVERLLGALFDLRFSE